MGAQARQLQLRLQEQEVSTVPEEAERALVAALAKLLLGAVEPTHDGADHESEDHR
jgi:hypothetical protein